jgi:NAD(P)H-hydrate repair Nnr-like enzyme with NAD(P)H-hydrate dehydratase domain
MTSETARAIAAAVFVHGLTAKVAAGEGRPVVATDLLDAVGPAIATLRGSR